jgi:hypothetical protein
MLHFVLNIRHRRSGFFTLDCKTNTQKLAASAEARMGERNAKFSSRPSAGRTNQQHAFSARYLFDTEKGFLCDLTTYAADKALKVNYDCPCFCASVELKSFYSSL